MKYEHGFRNDNIGGGYFYFTRMGLLCLPRDNKSLQLYVFMISHVLFGDVSVVLTERLTKKVMTYCGFKSRQQFYYSYRKLRDVGLVVRVKKNVYAINPKMFFFGNVGAVKQATLQYQLLIEGQENVYNDVDEPNYEDDENSEDYL